MAKVAVLVGDGYEDSELRIPVDRLRAAKHDVELVGATAGERVRGKRGEEEVTIARAASDAQADAYDALLIPGGWSPDHLRTDESCVELVRSFLASGKPIAAVCHGPQLLVEADGVRDRRVTSWPSVRTDLVNAGARWVDEPVVEDGALITSRKPADLEAFSAALIARLRQPARSHA